MVRGFTDAQIDALVRVMRERKPYTHKHRSDADLRLAAIEALQSSWRFRVVARLMFRFFGEVA